MSNNRSRFIKKENEKLFKISKNGSVDTKLCLRKERQFQPNKTNKPRDVIQTTLPQEPQGDVTPSQGSQYSTIQQTINFSDGYRYEGCATQDCIPEGVGKLYSPNNSLIYEGNFGQGKYQGKGTLYNLYHAPYIMDWNYEWIKIESEFNNGNLNGKTRIYCKHTQTQSESVFDHNYKDGFIQ